jgi:hypothetical protein
MGYRDKTDLEHQREYHLKTKDKRKTGKYKGRTQQEYERECFKKTEMNYY